MYSFLYVAYLICASLIVACLFYWALRTGQFKDQQRARFLPLVKEERPTEMSGGAGSRARGFLGLLVAGLLAAAVVIAYALAYKE